MKIFQFYKALDQRECSTLRLLGRFLLNLSSRAAGTAVFTGGFSDFRVLQLVLLVLSGDIHHQKNTGHDQGELFE